ncbi:hypothetical protein [Paenibacillus agricola]|uniref:Transcription initiation factor TFIID n=1 Tax=Paenibacillus agricola TaxID=2716264 RepID=A0ABX0JFK6_9BACL|nr:hypothetical protein [Paenibacillus agricola]NHN33009.1 hypothetical protein [Paenibacillus agricola]
MRNQLITFANHYAVRMDHTGTDEDEMRSINHPIVFVFLGDLSAEALDTMHALNSSKWNNSAGVVYLQIGTKPPAALDNVYGWSFAAPSDDKRRLRPAIHKQFYTDQAKLLELNVTLRQMNSRISQFGRMYTHLQRLNIAIVTRLDDPFNILLPEITVLMETIFGEQFRSVAIDLYGLLEEKGVGEQFAFQSSLGVSFLQEVDGYQSRDYAFKGMLQVTGEGVRLPAMHTASSLFDVVYLVSDKDERGIFAENGMQGSYEAICNLSLLKNRKTLNELDPKHGAYNNQHFKQNATPPDGEGRCYASVGLSRIKRPNPAIALTVLYHVYKHLLQRMKENAELDREYVQDLLELAPSRYDDDIRSLLQDPEKAVEGMFGLLHDHISLSELQSMTLYEAESALYGGNAQAFFEMNTARLLEKEFAERDFGGWLQKKLDTRIIDNPLFGFYAAYLCSSEGGSGSLVDELHVRIKEATKLLEQGQGELEQLYAERVADQAFAKSSLWGRLTNKISVKSFSRHLLDLVYGIKLDLKLLEMKLRLLRQYLQKLEELHERTKPFVQRLHQLEKTLQDASRGSILLTSDYLNRNINEYYGHGVREILAELESRRGAQFYWDERHMGNISQLLVQGEEPLLQRLMEVTSREIFVNPLFQKSFEDELLERANVAASYDNREVLSKEDLFRDLYSTLENEAAIRADVYHSTHKHRYIEKYFFGDFESEFIRYAFAVDQGSRAYKLGCVQEMKQSGIEKLNIMGGFRIEDLMYYRNGKRYYDTYMENGFAFHSMDTSTNQGFKEV